MADYKNLIIPRSYNAYADRQDLELLRDAHNHDIAETVQTITTLNGIINEQIDEINEQAEATSTIVATNTANIATNTANIAIVDNKIDTFKNNLDTDFSNPTNTNAPTTQAVKTYVDSKIIVLPIGFTYVQFPGQLEPSEMNFDGTWSKVDDYNGAYFRATKSGLSFGTTQAEELPNINGKIDNGSTSASTNFLSDGAGTTGTGAFRVQFGNRYSMSNGSTDNYPISFTFNANLSNSVYKDGGEVRPYTKVIQIWKRTA